MAFIRHTEFYDKLNGLAESIEQKGKAVGLIGLSWPERVVVEIWTGLGVIENGSFQFYFECHMDIDLSANACDAIGLENVGEIFRKAKILWMPVSQESEWIKRRNYIELHEEEFDSIAMEILGFTLEIERRLFAYVEENREAFDR